MIEIMGELDRRQRRRYAEHLFPDEDTARPPYLAQKIDSPVIYARGKYPRHMEFFEAGATFRQRCFLAANRVGKTVVGAYETAAHLTGKYPDWWPGRRFRTPIRAWAAGKTNETTRDVVQAELLGGIFTEKGRKGFDGTGMIAGDTIGSVTWKQGVSDLADVIKIRHVSGGWSTLGLKSYQQGRGSFEGTAQHLIWTDEEVPEDVYGEMLIRTATTDGLMLLTFTPLEGLTPVVMQFLPEDMRPEAAT